MTLVIFNADLFPHCKGDVVEISDEEKKDIDALVKVRGVQSPYAKHEAPKADK